MSPASADSSPTALAVKAVQLLGRWNRFVGAFKPYEPTCSCCIGLGIQSTEELELSLVCHLSERHVGNDTVAALLREGAGYEPGTLGSATRLLQAMARRSLAAPLDAQWMVVNDIEAALDIAEGSSASAGSPPTDAPTPGN